RRSTAHGQRAKSHRPNAKKTKRLAAKSAARILRNGAVSSVTSRPVRRRSALRAVACVAAFVLARAGFQAQTPAGQDGAPLRFKAAVDVVNLTATVFDGSGRFVPGLRREDFRVFEDDQLQVVTDFSADRVPVS